MIEHVTNLDLGVTWNPNAPQAVLLTDDRGTRPWHSTPIAVTQVSTLSSSCGKDAYFARWAHPMTKG